MRLGYSHTFIQREQSLGYKLDGVGVYTKLLYEEMERNHQHVLPFDFSSPRQLFNKNAGQPLAITSAVLPPFVQLHKAMEKQIDVFHSTDYLIPRLKNTAVVATLHDAIMFRSPEFASGLRKIKNPLLKHSAKWANHVIAISETMVDDLVTYWGIPQEKISIVHNGVEDIWYQRFSSEKIKEVLAKYSITKPFILNVGTIQPRKNISRLIQAYRNLPKHLKSEYQLIVAGREGWAYEALTAELNKLTENKEGLWLKYVDFEDLRALYQAATVFAFPSLSEGFGLPVLEAFASDTAVLSSNTTSIPEVAGDAALLVNPEDTDAIGQGLQSLLESESLRLSYQQKGLAKVEQFSWKRCAEETHKVLSQFA